MSDVTMSDVRERVWSSIFVLKDYTALKTSERLKLKITPLPKKIIITVSKQSLTRHDWLVFNWCQSETLFVIWRQNEYMFI